MPGTVNLHRTIGSVLFSVTVSDDVVAAEEQ